LSNEESTPNSTGINLSTLLIHNILLFFYHTSRLSFVVNTDNLGAKLEFTARGGRGKRFEEFDKSLTVYYTPGIEFRDTRNGSLALGGVEIDYFLRSFLECCRVVRE
jgi:hypothetical protein